MAKLTKEEAFLIDSFAEEFYLIPANLVTKEVLQLIHQSWEREDVFNNLNEAQEKMTYSLIKRLKSRKRKPHKVLDNMQPININPLFDDVS